MQKRITCALIILHSVIVVVALSQQKSKAWTIEEILSAKFALKSLSSAQWIDSGKRFSYLQTDSGTLVRSLYTYTVAGGKRDRAIDGAALSTVTRSTPFRIGSYQWSADGEYILLTGVLPARRTKTGGAFGVFSVKTRSFRLLSDPSTDQAIIKPSPDGSKIGFVRSNDLYVMDVQTGRETQLTFDGSGVIINGKFDWVYEEEFEIIDGWEWSPDSKRIAFWRLDQSAVPTFPLVRYPDDDAHAVVEMEHYPKAGDPNSIVKIGVVNVEKGEATWLNLGANTDIYIPRIKWTNAPEILSIQRLNRGQDTLDLMLANVVNGSVKTILTETDPDWIDVHDDLAFLKESQQFLWTSFRDGFTHIYLFTLDGSLVRQLTKGDWDVTQVVGVDERARRVYFLGTEASPLERHLYSVRFDGTGLHRLSEEPGWHSVSFAPDCAVYLDTYSSMEIPTTVTLRAVDGKRVGTIVSNSTTVYGEYPMGTHEFFSFTTSDGLSLNGWMIKPPVFNPAKRYPVLMYAYGVGNQTVTNQWRGTMYLWWQLLAQRGYIIVSVDGRGTEGRGKRFRQASFRHLGVPETKDQIEATKYLARLPFVDGSRIGISGSSGGGYLTLMAMTFGADYFKTGIAVSGISNHKFYDSIWTERYMDSPQENPEGYKETSPITYASKLKGNLLIIHGTVDDNVHWQNTIVLVNELVRQNKQVQTMFYPGRAHGIHGANATRHWFTLMTDFILEKL